MFIEEVKISIYTYEGNHWGRIVPFLNEDGTPKSINLIYAENEVGKSTLIKSLAYCLKGEDVYSPQAYTQLSNLTDVITHKVGGEHIKESTIFLQILNGTERIVIKRNALQSEQPVEVYKNIRISEIKDTTPCEFYKIRKDINIDGNETFNDFLMRLFNFPIHKFHNLKGGESQIYFQNLFPLFFIPQNAWNDIQGSNPSYGVSSYKKIAFQIIMNLSDVSIINDKFKLQEKRAELKELLKSKELLDEIISLAESNNSIALNNKIDLLNYDLDIYNRQIKDLEKENGIREESFEITRKEYRDLNIDIHNNQEEVNILDKEINQCSYYLNKIQMDILKVDKLKTAKKLIHPIPVSRCPHCFKDKIIDNEKELTSGKCDLCGSVIDSIPASSEEDLLDYLKDEKKDFENVLSSKDSKKRQINAKIYQDKLKVKEIKRNIDKIDLELKPKFLESYFSISNKIGSTENRITNLQKELKLVSNYETLIISINNVINAIRKLEKTIRAVQESGSDESKLNRFSGQFKKYLGAMDFLKYEKSTIKSDEPEKEKLAKEKILNTFLEKLSINHDDYKPEINDKNIYNITSASGLIRIINAYYLALIETCLFFHEKTNHPGFVIFDEPRQQNLDIGSFKKMTQIYVDIANMYKDKVQIIFASGNRGVFKTDEIQLELSQDDFLIRKFE